MGIQWDLMELNGVWMGLGCEVNSTVYGQPFYDSETKKKHESSLMVN